MLSVNSSVEDIDLFVGGLAEPPNAGGGQLGDTFSGIVARQMRRLKFGDRFFFTHRSFEGTLVFNDGVFRSGACQFECIPVPVCLVVCLAVNRLVCVAKTACMIIGLLSVCLSTLVPASLSVSLCQSVWLSVLPSLGLSVSL